MEDTKIMNYMERYEFWRNAGLPADVCQELDSIANDSEELKGRFGSDLQFRNVAPRTGA